jgi:hypothetical protein
MKYILNFIVRFRNMLVKEPPKPVGRWGLEKCNIQIGRKADLSNEDHCGPCGQYALKKLETEKTHVK